MPAADIEIDAPLVERLLRAQHPDLDGPLTLVANGWDNAIFRLGDNLCVRLPRRRVAADLIVNEQRWLPHLATFLGARIPAPVRVGVPSDVFLWPWTIAPWFDGRTLADVPVPERTTVAADLAIFLAELHVPASADAPRNPFRGVPLADRRDVVEQRLADGAIPRSGELRAVWDELVTVPPWSGPPVWLHGDTHPANFLTAEHAGERHLTAVLDWGDLTSGDPASDPAIAWLVFDAHGRASFRAEVDRLMGMDVDSWERARGWALAVGTALAAHSDDSPCLAAVGRHVLGQVVQ